MKKYIPFLIGGIVMSASLSVSSITYAAGDAEPDSPQIITTIFPEYDWVMNILGDNPAGADVTMLLDNGVDLHSYQPTAEDIMKISTCDLFIYVGGESDKWVDDALKESVNKDMIVLDLMDLLGDRVREEEIVEGMQEEEHDHHHEDGEGHEEGEDHEKGEDLDAEHEEDEDQDSEHEEGEEHEHDHEEVEYDEHVWLSLRNAAVLTEGISDALQKVDPDHAGLYRANSEAYIAELDRLDAEYSQAVEEGSLKTLLFGDRFPFRYMTDDYGLTYYAAFVGCSAETEASFETIVFLAQKVDELSLHTILTIEGTDHRIAETIKENTKTRDQQILTMDSMQSVTAKDVEAGCSYLSFMENNLDVLREALS